MMKGYSSETGTGIIPTQLLQCRHININAPDTPTALRMENSRAQGSDIFLEP
jgi:hypothetical protein